MSLEIALRHRLGAFSLDLAFLSEAGVIALFGPSGSGKTSVVNAIAGLLRPDSGRVVVDGATVLDTKAGVFVPPHRRRVGLVFQDARLFPHLTVRQNLVFGRWFTPRAERRGDLDHVVALLGIGHLLKRRPAGLSGGERQRVAIGRALMNDPDLVLVDEPTAALDTALGRQVVQLLRREIKDRGKTGIMVTHDLRMVEYTDRVFEILDGHLTHVEEPSALKH